MGQLHQCLEFEAQTEVAAAIRGCEAAVELVPLGSNYVLHNQNVGSIALANAGAASIWTALASGGDPDIVVEDLVQTLDVDQETAVGWLQQLLQSWQDAGVFNSPTRSFRQKLEVENWNWSARYKVCNRVVELRCEDPSLGKLLDRVLGPLRSDGAASARVCVTGPEGSYRIIGAEATQALNDMDIAVARHMALRNLICSAETRRSAVFHAGAIEVDNQAVLIAGDTGAGKTTLTTGLILLGCRYIADDLVGLDQSGQLVGPFHVALSLKPGSYGVLADTIAAQTDLDLTQPDEYGLRYLDASKRSSPKSDIKVARIVFPNYGPASEALSIRPVSPEEALHKLLETGTRVVGRPGSIAPLAKLLSAVPAHELTYSSWPDAARYVMGGQLS